MRGRRRGGRRGQDDDNGFAAWGGYMAAKKQKLEEQFSKDVEKSEKETKDGIFNGIAIFVNGYTDPTADELKRIMMTHGGIFHHYQSSRTTHIIATNLPDTKVKNLKGNEPICHPRWISESLKAGKLLDYTKYLLYSNVSSSQPKLNFQPRAKDAKDEKFLGEFYNNSRLHHISTMGANFKEYVNQLRTDHSGDFSQARSKLRPSEGYNAPIGNKKVIMHIDMDCFFVSVGLRKHPDLIGKPVAVTHSKGSNSTTSKPHNAESLKIEMSEYQKRLQQKAPQGLNAGEVAQDKVKTMTEAAGISMSEIASCSYEARAAGVKNGMFMGTALKLCPNLQTIPYDFESYQEVAKTLYDTVAEYTLDIQAVSCDEMLVDLTDIILDRSISPKDFAEHLRSEMKAKTNCNASVGIGSSILLARMATKKAKPNGVFALEDNQAKEYFKEVSVSDLPGVGRTNNHKFKAMGIENCAQLQEVPLASLKHQFGPKFGASLHNYCRGIDDRPITFVQERKSVSAEVNYGIRFNTQEEMERFLGQLSEEVAMRLAKIGEAKGRQIILKVMVRSANAPAETAKFLGHGLCDSHSKGSTLSMATNEPSIIKKEALMLMNMLRIDPKELRGVGIQVGKLERTREPGMMQTKSILNFMTKKRPTNFQTMIKSPAKEQNVEVQVPTASSNANATVH